MDSGRKVVHHANATLLARLTIFVTAELGSAVADPTPMVVFATNANQDTGTSLRANAASVTDMLIFAIHAQDDAWTVVILLLMTIAIVVWTVTTEILVWALTSHVELVLVLEPSIRDIPTHLAVHWIVKHKTWCANAKKGMPVHAVTSALTTILAIPKYLGASAGLASVAIISIFLGLATVPENLANAFNVCSTRKDLAVKFAKKVSLATPSPSNAHRAFATFWAAIHHWKDRLSVTDKRVSVLVCRMLRACRATAAQSTIGKSHLVKVARLAVAILSALSLHNVTNLMANANAAKASVGGSVISAAPIIGVIHLTTRAGLATAIRRDHPHSNVITQQVLASACPVWVVKNVIVALVDTLALLFRIVNHVANVSTTGIAFFRNCVAKRNKLLWLLDKSAKRALLEPTPGSLKQWKLN